MIIIDTTIEDYLEKEKLNLLRSLTREYDWITPERLIKETISQCFGVIMFMSEYSDLDFKELDALWTEYHEFFKGLLKKY